MILIWGAPKVSKITAAKDAPTKSGESNPAHVNFIFISQGTIISGGASSSNEGAASRVVLTGICDLDLSLARHMLLLTWIQRISNQSRPPRDLRRSDGSFLPV